MDSKLLTTNFDKEYNLNFDRWKTKVEVLHCDLIKVKRRQKKVILDHYTIYATSWGTSFSMKKFNCYLESCIYFAESVFPKYLQSIEKERQRFIRLRHNLVSISASITNEVYQIVPQEQLSKGGKSQIAFIADIISTDLKGVANNILKILKGVTQMKSEFDVYDLLGSSNVQLDFYKHPLHKIILLALNAFWLDFISHGISVEVEETYESVQVDYNTFSVALYHIFDNALKYSAPNHKIKVTFSKQPQSILIKFQMLSLKINNDEIFSIFDEGVSGFWTNESNKSGDGIGMFITKKLVEMNNGSIEILNNINNTTTYINDLPYEDNIIVLTIPISTT